MGQIEPEPIDLILYVSANSPQADEAVAKMRAALERFNSPKIRVTVCPLPEAHSSDGDGDGQPARMAIVPIRQSGTVRTLVLGHVTQPEILLELLTDCDFD
jgi:hypothetical protein